MCLGEFFEEFAKNALFIKAFLNTVRFNDFMNLVKTILTKLGIPTQGLGFSYMKNTGMVAIATAVENILSYIIILVLSRTLGAEGLGQYSFLFAFVGFFFIFSDWGMSPLMVRDLSRDFKDVDKYVSNILTFKTLLLLISFVVYAITIFFIGKNDLISALFVVGLLTLASSYGRFFKNILRVQHKAKTIAWSSIIERLVALLVGIVVLWLFRSLFLFVIVLFASQVIKTLILWLVAKKHFTYAFSLQWPFLKDLFKQGYPFILIVAFASVYVRIDTLFLSFMQGDVVTGWYNAAYKLINILNVIPMVLLTFGFPLFSKLYKTSKKNLQKLLEKLLYYSMVLLLPIVVGVMLLSSRIIEFVYDFQSPETALVFQILIIAQVFVFLTTLLSQFMAACDKQIQFAIIAGIGAGINILFNILLIPKYSLYGAAIATTITYALMFVIMYFYIQKNMLRFNFLKKLWLPLIASAGLWFLISYIIHLQLFLIVGASVLMYGSLLLFSEVIGHKLTKKKSAQK